MHAKVSITLTLVLAAPSCRTAELPAEEFPTIVLVENDGERARFRMTNESSHTFRFLGHSGARPLPLTMVRHWNGAEWETFLTALGCATNLEAIPLPPGESLRLWALLDEPRPTRLGLGLFGPHGSARTVWSEPVHPAEAGDGAGGEG